MKSAVPSALASGRGELVAFARRRVGARADDVVQEAAVRALRHADQLEDPAAARAWLFTIVRRLMAEQGERPVEAVGEPRAPDDAVPDACDCVMTQVRALPEAQAALLQRVVIDGADITKLARELGITPNNAWVRLHRARQALKKRLKNHCGTESLRACLDCGCVERGCCR